MALASVGESADGVLPAALVAAPPAVVPAAAAVVPAAAAVVAAAAAVVAAAAVDGADVVSDLSSLPHAARTRPAAKVTAAMVRSFM